MHHILLVPSYADEHVSGFYFRVAANNAAVITGVQRLVWTGLLRFSWSETAG